MKILKLLNKNQNYRMNLKFLNQKQTRNATTGLEPTTTQLVNEHSTI